MLPPVPGTRRNIGKVWLVGAGPGDPELITVRGAAVLRRADVVLYDALSHPALLEWVGPSAELRNVGKRGGRSSPSQSWITEQLIALAREGKQVVRLKGGDSYLFARGAEEALALAEAGIEFEVVPGLSSPVGTSAYAGIPLTHRELSSSVTFITGSDRAGKEWSEAAWERLSTATETLCILMGMRRIRQIVGALISGGRSPRTPTAVVQWGARPAQRVVTASLADIADVAERAGMSNPAVIIVGEVVRLRQQLDWFERKPLFGRRVLITRAAHQSDAVARAVRELGAEPLVYPVIEIVPPPDLAPLRQAIAQLDRYHWVLFTSANGVERFFAQLRQQQRDARSLSGCRVGAIGPKTAAALEPHGVQPDLVADEFVGEALAQRVLEAGPAGARVLIPRALQARMEMVELLSGAGCEVEVVATYQTIPLGTSGASQLREQFRAGEIDTVLWTSSSTVTATVQALGDQAAELLRSTCVASIGPITTARARELGVHVDVTAKSYTVDGLLEALAEHVGGQHGE